MTAAAEVVVSTRREEACVERGAQGRLGCRARLLAELCYYRKDMMRCWFWWCCLCPASSWHVHYGL